jgi:MFS family permease
VIERVATNFEADAYHPFLAWWTVVVLAVFQTVSLIDRNILSLVLIEIRRDLHLNDFELSLLQGLALSCAYGLAGVLVGGLMDRVRLPRILYICVTCWSLAAMAVGLARNYWGMMLSRMLTGAGEGGITPVGQVLIVSLFPKNRVSLPMSIFFTSGSIGIGLSYFGGGLLLEALTTRPIPGLESLAPWRQVLLITALPGLLVAFLSFTLRDAGPRCIASHSSLRRWGEFGRFLAAERKLFGRLIAAYGLMAIITLAVFSWAPTYGRRVLQLRPSEVGLQLGLISTIGGIFAAGIYGHIVDKQFSRGKIDFVLRAFSVGAIVAIPACVIGFSVDRLWGFLSAVIAVQLILGASFGPGVAAIHMITPPEMRGRMGALMVIVVNLSGYALGPVLVGALTDFVFADPQKVGLSIGMVAAVLGPISAWCAWSARSHFVQRVRGFQGS